MNAPIAEFTDYQGLRRALNSARDLRDMSFELMNEITGAPPGYFNKALGPKAIKRIGLQSLGWAMGGLGVKCILVEDTEALALIQARLKGRDVAHLASVHNGAVHVTVNRGFLRKIGAKGGTNSRKNLGKRMTRKLAQKAANARWDKVRSKEEKRRARQRKAAHKARKASTRI